MSFAPTPRERPKPIRIFFWISFFNAWTKSSARTAEIPLPIGGVAVCSFVNNILGLDQNNRVVIPLTTYADTRSAGEVPGLRKDFEEERTHDRTGCHFHPSYLPARFRWLARSRPDLFRKSARFVSIGEYLELKLFGEAAVSYSVASWTGLLNRNALQWDRELLQGLPVRIEQLSCLTDVSRPRRGLRPEFSRRWPALREVPWFPAVGDGATANVGSGCVSPKRVALTVGTTSAMRVVLTARVESIPSGLWCYRVDGRRSLLGGALSEGGSVFAWMRSALRFDLEGLEKKLSALEPDGHGLTVLPFFRRGKGPRMGGPRPRHLSRDFPGHHPAPPSAGVSRRDRLPDRPGLRTAAPAFAGGSPGRGQRRRHPELPGLAADHDQRHRTAGGRLRRAGSLGAGVGPLGFGGPRDHSRPGTGPGFHRRRL